jgi:hypothetical protein
MVRSYLVLAGVAATTLGIFAVNCGGNVTSGGTMGTGGGPVDLPHAEPPGPGPMKPGDGAASVTFAISKLYLGDTDPDGTPDKANGWKKFGYDLDGKISTATSTDLCKPRNNAAPKDVYPDGDDGIDNSFGKRILPIILGIAMDAPKKINDGITGGQFTIILDMQKLGTGTDYNPIVTNLFAGGDLMAAPKFDGTDMWPVRPELLKDGMTIASGSKVSFPTSYVAGNTWVSGSKGSINLALSVSGFSLDLTISSALVSLQLDAAHKKGTRGVIAGVLATDVLTGELQKVAGAFDPSLCTGATIQSIITQIEQASDIMVDGPQDPTKPCDGISIGLGFDADIIQLGAVAPPSPPKPNPCDKDAGADGG